MTIGVGKKLSTLELPEEEVLDPIPQRSADPTTASRLIVPPVDHRTPNSIPLPPIPPPPKREVMVQLSIKAPLLLVERLESMTRVTGAQKQAVMASALDAYLRGHGY